jgi:hypothetical protein
MGMLLQRHYEARDASATAKRDALLAEVEAARLQQAEVAIQRVRAVQEADDVPCAACMALHGARPCSVECYVKAGYKADDFDALIVRIEADLVATEAAAKAEAEAKVAAELAAQAAAEATAKAEAEAKQAEEARLVAEAIATDEVRKAEAEVAAIALAKAEADRKAAEAAELAALEEATRPDESKPESKSSKPSRK